MKKTVTTNALRIRLIRALQKEGKKLHKIKGGEWLVIYNNQIVEQYESIDVFAQRYNCIKEYEEYCPEVSRLRGN